ncbi:MAG: DNA replication/repair protein RecF [Scytolyngbya sp. HA4215-MV1]|jgi:DNA replication and repair protein RecF|nr:DNA replication/repair protein RecF [Scytolyngbya sp. HA4215-MV1]
MYLKALHLRQFRNYQDQFLEFSAPKTILVGDNAQGKSNLLEAVELLSTLRSHRTSRDRDLILAGESIGQVTARLERDTGAVDLAVTLRSNGRRTVSLNSESLRRQFDFLGILNVVQFSSLDLDLVRGAPERRRHWMDALLVQLEPVYAYILQQYNQVLRQRNALLKAIRKAEGRGDGEIGRWGDRENEGDDFSQALDREANPLATLDQLAFWDAQLALTGSRVIRRRARVLQRLAPLAEHWHQEISGQTEVLQVSYAPNVGLAQDDPQQLQTEILVRIQQKRVAEQYQGTTLVGPHRDEVEFAINRSFARQYGSQGQQRTLVLALKLAELKLIEEVIGEPPLLLLDDVLAELDLHRQNQLLNAVQDRFQTLITTTHLGSFDAQWLNSSQILQVQAGQLMPPVR